MHEIQGAILDAKKQVALEKKQITREIQLESQRLAKIAKDIQEKEQRQRQELIQSIRLLEQKVEKPKIIDKTETSGLGLLGEMSLLELEERLSVATRQSVEQLNAKKQILARHKRDKQLELRHKQEQLDLDKVKKRSESKMSVMSFDSQSTLADNKDITELSRKVMLRKMARLKFLNETSVPAA